MTVRSGRAMSASAVFSVVDLPEPVGPVTSSAPTARVDEPLDLHLHRIREAEIGERGRRAELAEQAHHDAFAVNGRKNRHAHVDRCGRRSCGFREPTVLRPTALGDVETCHHLDPGNGGGGILRRQRRVLLHDTVHSEADVVAVLGRDHMYVACLRRDGGAQDRVHRLDGGVLRKVAFDQQLLGVERAAAHELLEDLADVLVRSDERPPDGR